MAALSSDVPASFMPVITLAQVEANSFDALLKWCANLWSHFCAASELARDAMRRDAFELIVVILGDWHE